MEKTFDFIASFSSTAVVGLISSILTSILVWLVISKSRAKESNELLTRALDLLILALQGKQKFNLRASVMLLDKSGKLRIKYTSSNMISAPDSTIILEKWQGVAGKALGYQEPIIADLTIPKLDKDKIWGLTYAQYVLTQNIKTIYSFPIRDPKNMETVIGTLNIDSSEPITDYLNSDEVRDIISNVATQIALLIHE